MIFDLDDLKFLYPNISKKCFKKFLDQVNTCDDYYVNTLRAMLPGKDRSPLSNYPLEHNHDDSPDSNPDNSDVDSSESLSNR